MKPDKMPNPMDIGFFSSMTVMLETDALPDNFQQHRFFGYFHVSTFLYVIKVPLSKGQFIINQLLTCVQPVIHDINRPVLSDACGVYL
jgi:hypothetical protein